MALCKYIKHQGPYAETECGKRVKFGTEYCAKHQNGQVSKHTVSPTVCHTSKFIFNVVNGGQIEAFSNHEDANEYVLKIATGIIQSQDSASDKIEDLQNLFATLRIVKSELR